MMRRRRRTQRLICIPSLIQVLRSCVVLPEPVSPTITTTRFSEMTRKFLPNRKIGRNSRCCLTVLFRANDEGHWSSAHLLGNHSPSNNRWNLELRRNPLLRSRHPDIRPGRPVFSAAFSHMANSLAHLGPPSSRRFLIVFRDCNARREATSSLPLRAFTAKSKSGPLQSEPGASV